MTVTRVRELDAAARSVFDAKGAENAVRVRRVIQLTADLARMPWQDLRILDLGCGEGVFSIEAALRGAEVVAIDGRVERMDLGRAIARRHGLERLTFTQDDVRNVTAARYGEFDAVYMLGLLYHLDAPDLFTVLRAVRGLSRGFAIIDTHVAVRGETTVTHDGVTYHGRRYGEHARGDPPEKVAGRLRASLDNPLSFWLTRDSLCRALREAGFTSVQECHVPAEPFLPADRATFVAWSGQPVELYAYPWVNGLPESTVEQELGARLHLRPGQRMGGRRSIVGVVRRVLRLVRR